MNIPIEPLTADNGGFFTRAQVLDLGATERELKHELRTGAITRIRHGAYAPTRTYSGLSPAQQHLVLARAVVHAQEGAVALTGPSAAVAHGFDVHDQDLHVVHVLRLDGGSSRDIAGVKHHRMTDALAANIVEVSGTPVVEPALTVWDLARTSSLEAGVVTADSALRRQPDLRARLNEVADALVHQPGSPRARTVLRLADGNAETVGESVTRVQFHRFRIPMPTLQFELFDGDGVLIARHDFGWEGHRHLGEFDGKIKYGELLRPGEKPADALVREKVREDRARAERYGMTRFIWSMIIGRAAAATMAMLQSQLASSKRIYVV